MIRGQKQSIEPTNEHVIDVGMNIHNRFDVELVDSITGRIKQKAVGYNTICNQLWQKLFTPASYFNYIHYGTGTGTPASTDTSLFDFLGYGSAGSEKATINEEDGIFALRRSIQLAPEIAVGKTITEVGIAHSSSSNSLCTHAMLQDMNGNPISIHKTDTDVINIYATIYLHYKPKGYMNGSAFLGGHSQDIRFMKSLCGAYESNAWPNYAFASPAWGMYNQAIQPYSDSVGVEKSYDLSNKSMTFKMERMGVSTDNTAIREIMFAGYRTSSSSSYPKMWGPCFQLVTGQENGWFPPFEIEAEAIGTGDGEQTVFSTAFPFASKATIYVDGVALTNGVSVSNGINACDYPNKYVSAIMPFSTPNRLIPANLDIGGYRRLTASSNEHYVGTDKWYYFYNPAYNTAPVTNIYWPYCTLEASTDLEHWEQVYVFTDTSTKSCPVKFQNYPYWRAKRSRSYAPEWGNDDHYGELTMAATSGNVVFDTPPAAGSVITIDYTTPVIPKDENHVLDVTVTIQLGEYKEDE